MKIAIVSESPQHRQEIENLLRSGSLDAHQVLAFPGGFEQVDEAQRLAADLILLERGEARENDLAALEAAAQRHPEVPIVLLCNGVAPDFVIGAMRMGARDVLQFPLSQDVLRKAIERAGRHLTERDRKARHGEVWAFIACKGGSGATFLATNLAYLLAAKHGKSVAAIDLNLQFGDASLFLSSKLPSSTLADVADHIGRLDAALLEASMVRVLPNLGILAAPETPERASEVRPEHVELLLSVAADNYDCVILDMGRMVSAVSVKALDRADLIFPVLQQTLPFIRDAKRILATFRSLGYGESKVRLLINRFEKGADIGLDDVEKTLGAKVFHAVPNSFRTVSASVNQGVPVGRISPRDPVSRSLENLAETLLEHALAGKRSWVSRVLGKG